MNIQEYLQEEAALDSLIAPDSRTYDLCKYVAVWLYSRNRSQFEEVASEYFQQEAAITVMRTAVESTNQFQAALKDLL